MNWTKERYEHEVESLVDYLEARGLPPSTGIPFLLSVIATELGAQCEHKENFNLDEAEVKYVTMFKSLIQVEREYYEQ